MNRYGDLEHKCEITTRNFLKYELPEYLRPETPVIRLSFELRLGKYIQAGLLLPESLSEYAPFAVNKEKGFFKLIPGKDETRSEFVKRVGELSTIVKESFGQNIGEGKALLLLYNAVTKDIPVENES